MFKVVCAVLLVNVMSACAFNPTHYDELRQSEAEHYRMLGA
ncbi:hypothetical protein [uncultured Acinetobacter sp.]|nr:hypothetical protein [uncultured Acinetobacter sp.]